MMKYSDLYCVKCGHKGIPVRRREGAQRDPGHLKKMYCLYCGEETNHAEIKEGMQTYTFDMFKIEFEYGNFAEDGTRKDIHFKHFLSLVNAGMVDKVKDLKEGCIRA